MNRHHSPRHTRRGFLRGDSTPKFFPILPLNSKLDPGPQHWTAPESIVSPNVPPPPTAQEVSDRTIDFHPPDEELLRSLEGTLSAKSGNAFLSWLAEQIADQAHGPDESATRNRQIDFDPQAQFFDSQLESDGETGEDTDATGDGWALDLCYDFEYPEVQPVELASQGTFARGRSHPTIEMSPDGGRMERFAAGSKVLKDVLGRVVEVQSRSGERLLLRYGVHGSLDCFERTDRGGRTHSQGRKDKHGVVVRDPEGRVRAAGESMSVDPRGCFYLHSVDGQYVSLDLVAGIHSERRKIPIASGNRFVTSLFTYDGFRMATMFAPGRSTESGARNETVAFRFYGRDGTLIEFYSEDDLRELKPSRVTAPGARRLNSGGDRRQASTAWDSVHEYLVRVS